MEQATELQLDEKTKDLIIAYIIRYDDIGKAIEKAGVTEEEFRAWERHDKGEEFNKRLYAFKNDYAKTIIRDPDILEPIAQWLENTRAEILPLLYNFDGLDDDAELKAFVDKHNIYTGSYIYTYPIVKQANPEHSRLKDFQRELHTLRAMIDKYLAGEELSELEKVRAGTAFHDRTVATCYGELDGSILKNLRRYKAVYNIGGINIKRAYGDMWEVIEGRKQLRRCADHKCNKIFVPRRGGGSKQEYHAPDCARRVRQRKAYRRRKLLSEKK